MCYKENEFKEPMTISTYSHNFLLTHVHLIQLIKNLWLIILYKPLSFTPWQLIISKKSMCLIHWGTRKLILQWVLTEYRLFFFMIVLVWYLFFYFVAESENNSWYSKNFVRYPSSMKRQSKYDWQLSSHYNY